jgi:hypothetical protein
LILRYIILSLTVVGLSDIFSYNFKTIIPRLGVNLLIFIANIFHYIHHVFYIVFIWYLYFFARMVKLYRFQVRRKLIRHELNGYPIIAVGSTSHAH